MINIFKWIWLNLGVHKTIRRNHDSLNPQKNAQNLDMLTISFVDSFYWLVDTSYWGCSTGICKGTHYNCFLPKKTKHILCKNSLRILRYLKVNLCLGLCVARVHGEPPAVLRSTIPAKMARNGNNHINAMKRGNANVAQNYQETNVFPSSWLFAPPVPIIHVIQTAPPSETCADHDAYDFAVLDPKSLRLSVCEYYFLCPPRNWRESTSYISRFLTIIGYWCMHRIWLRLHKGFCGGNQLVPNLPYLVALPSWETGCESSYDWTNLTLLMTAVTPHLWFLSHQVWRQTTEPSSTNLG